MKYFANFKTLNYDILGDGKTREITDVFRKVRVDPKILDNITFYTFYNILNGERPDIVSYKLYGRIDYHWTFNLLNPWLLDVRRDWPMNNVELDDYIFQKYTDDAIMISNRELATKYTVGEVVQGLASGARATLLAKNVNLGYLKIRKLNSRNFFNGELVRGETSSDFLTIESERKFYNAPHHYELGGVYVDRFKTGALPITNYEYEVEKNESHTRIKVIRPELIEAIAEKFIETINA